MKKLISKKGKGKIVRCPNCKAKLNVETKFCYNCGHEFGSKIERGNRIIARLILAVALTLVLAIAVGFSFAYFSWIEVPILSDFLGQHGMLPESKQVYSSVDRDIQDLLSGEISTVNRVIFHEDETSFFYENEVVEEQGETSLIGSILQMDEISIENVDDHNKTITFRIFSPDLHTFFEDNLEELSSVEGSEAFIELMCSYAEEQERREQKVSLPYLLDGNALKVAYTERDFIDAITGGLMESYGTAYSKILEAYLEEAGK